MFQGGCEINFVTARIARVGRFRRIPKLGALRASKA
jgi:hypothetical protein